MLAGCPQADSEMAEIPALTPTAQLKDPGAGGDGADNGDDTDMRGLRGDDDDDGFLGDVSRNPLFKDRPPNGYFAGPKDPGGGDAPHDEEGPNRRRTENERLRDRRTTT